MTDDPVWDTLGRCYVDPNKEDSPMTLKVHMSHPRHGLIKVYQSEAGSVWAQDAERKWHNDVDMLAD